MSRVQSLREIKRSRKNLLFFACILIKSFKIFFRSDKSIKMIHASFSNKQVSNSTVIKFRFRNALWYEFENVNTDKREFAISKAGFLEKRTLIVHGFFRTKKYILTFDETNKADKKTKFCQAFEKFKTQAEEDSYPSAVFVRN